MPLTSNASQPATWALILIGACAGVASGTFGIGGGIIIVPALVFFLGFSQHRATGTSLALMLPPIGVLAVMEYWRQGNVDVRAASWICVAMVLGAGLGGVVANRLPGAWLKLFFGAFIILLGIWMVYSSWRKIRSGAVA